MATQHVHNHTWVPQWEFGDRLRKVRTDLGYDQKEFAKLLDLKAPTLSSYESGRANPRAKDLPTLAARLELLTNVPRAWFMGWETENPHQSPDGGNESRLRDLNARPVLYKGNPSPLIDMFQWRASA